MTEHTDSGGTTRTLPAGYDNPDSPSFVPEELRAPYISTTLDPKRLDNALNAEKHAEFHRMRIKAWEARRRWQERRWDPDTYRTWLREQTVDGDMQTPRRWALDQLDGLEDTKGRPIRPDMINLTEDQVRQVIHRATLEQVQEQAKAARQAAQHQARRTAEHTCSMCGAVDPNTTQVHPRELGSAGGPYQRVCPGCQALALLVRHAMGTTPSGRTRLAVLVELASSAPEGGGGSLTAADIDAWLDDPTATGLPTPGGARLVAGERSTDAAPKPGLLARIKGQG